MINLLSPQQKEEILIEEKFKIVLILGIIVMAFLVSSVLILFSIKNLIFVDFKTQEIYLEQREKEINTQKNQDLEEKIKNYNLIFSNLDSFYKKQIYLSDIFNKLSDALPVGVYLTGINFNSVTSQFSLSGFAYTRENLLILKDGLEKEELFTQVYFPPANWVTPADINFSVNFKLK